VLTTVGDERLIGEQVTDWGDNPHLHPSSWTSNTRCVCFIHNTNRSTRWLNIVTSSSFF